MEFSKEELFFFPIRIKLHRLEFKYLSMNGLSKTSILVGKPLKVNKNTKKKIGNSFI